MILCVGTTPAAQRVMFFRELTPGAVNRAVEVLDGAAGKSVNVARVLKTLGARVFAVGVAGGDRGAEVRRALAAGGIDHEFVSIHARTRQCITVVDKSSGLITELVEESPAIDAEEHEQLVQVIVRRARECRAVVMSGTIARGASPDLYGRVTRLARESGARAVVDAQGSALMSALAARPSLVKPNREELAATLGRKLETEVDVVTAMKELHARGAEGVVVTAGKDPVLASDGKAVWRVRTPDIRAVNPIGSGDALTAGVVWRLVQGEALGEACLWGAAAGAANALTAMPGEVNLADIERLRSETTLERLG